MHFHEKADCSDAAFKNAGGHVHAKTPVTHGLLNTDANDAGDLPNLYVSADGTATVELYSTLVSMKGEGGRPALRGNSPTLRSSRLRDDGGDDGRNMPLPSSRGCRLS
jgi:Cu/Zn superoxide dismutase